MSNDSFHIAQTVQTQIQGIGIANVLFRMKRLAREGLVFKIQDPGYTQYSLRRVKGFVAFIILFSISMTSESIFAYSKF